MRLLVADGGQGCDHHVEPIEPRPALDEMKARRASDNHECQSSHDETQIVKRAHKSSRQSSVVGRQQTMTRVAQLLRHAILNVRLVIGCDFSASRKK